jgi:predicted GH43/DUF377 family glycosyl hydrolase
MDASNFSIFFLALAGLFLACLALLFYWLSQVHRPLRLSRHAHNPVLRPLPEHWWESEAVFNPAAFVHDGRVHLLYRALGKDGISRIGHASSRDGMHFDERSEEPVYDRGAGFTPTPEKLKLSYETLTYNQDMYASGGGWGGIEDPRAVKIDDRIYMSFGIFESWQSMRLGISSLAHLDFDDRKWKWEPHVTISPKGQTNKNWVLFPQKINDKFAILHALTPKIMIEYVDDLTKLREKPIVSNNQRSGRVGRWDALIRGAGAPPILTDYGWLLLYHGMDPAKNTGYEVGAMLLDLHDPTKILYQSDMPILKPQEWYENEWKAGVVYASGACVFKNELWVYYGGGDKYVAAAHAPLRDFLRKLMSHQHAVLEPARV